MSARHGRLMAGVPLVWLTVFVAVPIAIVATMAFATIADRVPPIAPLVEHAGGGVITHLSFDSVAAVLRDPLYRAAFGNALLNALETTILCVLLGFPVAYAIALAPERRRRYYVMLAIVPFWTSFLMRTYAWMGLIRDSGPVNAILIHLGIIDRPVHLLYSPGAVLLVMVYSYIPFFILPMYAVLEKLPRDLLEAAADLGARPAYLFRTVTLPLALPGLAAGSLLVFVPAVGEYIIPDLVGNNDTIMIGSVLWAEFFENRDWPTAAAVALLATLALVLPALWLRARLVPREAQP